MGLFSFLFGCKNNNSDSETNNSDHAKIEEITSRINPEEGWSDIFLKITEDTKTDTSHIYIAKGLYNNKTVGLRIEVSSKIGAGVVNGIPDGNAGFVGNAVQLQSIGQESDELVKALAELYKRTTDKGFTKQTISATAFSLNEKSVNLEKKDYYKLKLFFAEEDENLYSEIYLNINTDKREIELLIDFHENAKRQGPGSNDDTLKALSFIAFKTGQPLKIADIGCGSGAQTIALAQNIEGHITAVDLFPEFLDKLNANSKELGLQNKITTLEKSMDDLPFANEEFDIIWSEGAIYNIGFETGVKKWKEYLKPGGYIALSEITWITNSRPNEIEEHWNKEYPQIDTASNKIKIIEENGFSPVGYFYLPVSSWIDNYYQPMEERFDAFLKKHNNSELAKSIVDGEKEEIRKYKKYKDFLSYGFYVAKKI